MAATLLLLCLFAGGDPETFLIDDNRTQWHPVMERAYEDLWTTGKIHCYDLYQMKGMPVAQQGYYGVMNPFILLSYAVSCLLSGRLPVITVYIGIMVLLGNLFVFLISRRLGCGEKTAFLMTMVYSTLGCFWSFFYWYYVFNNYFLIPLLVYVFLCCRNGRAAYWIFGIILAVDLWMGNVQYTCYHYILFGIICLAMVALKEYRYFGILCANVATGIGLSLPMFVLLIRASGEFQNHESFLENPIFYFSLLLHSVIPHGIIHELGGQFSFLGSYVMGRDDNLVLYMGAVVILLCVLLIRSVGKWLGRVRKCRSLAEVCGTVKADYQDAVAWSHEQKMLAGCVMSLFFFLSLMSGGLAAYTLYVLPVVGNFRYLFKALFVAAPLAVLILAWIIGEKRKAEDGKCGETCRFRAVVSVLMIIFACVGIFNACGTVRATKGLFDRKIHGNFVEEKMAAINMLEDADMDCRNYRTATFLRFAGINDEHFNLSENLSKNFSTAIGAFSLSGYEIATEKKRLETFDAIYSEKDFFAKYGNADTLQNFWQNLTKNPEKVQRQLIDNSVRYLLLDKTELEDNQRAKENPAAFAAEDYREDVILALHQLPAIRIVRTEEFNAHYDLVEIEGINSLCMDSAGNKIPLTDLNMETVIFNAQTAGEYTLSFGWDRHLEAFLTEQDGTEYSLSIEEMENGNILISTQGRCGKVTLTYHDPVCTMGFVWEAVVSIVFVWTMAWMFKTNKKYMKIS